MAMKVLRSALLPMLACALFVGSAAAMSPSAASADSQETINGIAIIPGVERLSYVSMRYQGIRPTYDACVKRTQGRASERGDCADTEYSYQDSRLNHAYMALIVGLSGIDKRSVVDAQRTWLAFFAKDCSAVADRFGSDDAPATESICRMEKTAFLRNNWRTGKALLPYRVWRKRGVSDDELIAIRQYLQQERASASKLFQAMAEKTLGRPVSLRQPGRPSCVDAAPGGI